MNYYIDFDHTLYDTPKLTKDMLDTISCSIALQCGIEQEVLLEECFKMFNRENIYNIYELARYFSKKYNCDSKQIIDKLNYVIYNSEKNVFSDSIPFLKKLKSLNHTIHMLSYYEYGLEYQTAKIVGSKLSNLFDCIIITKKHKYELDLDYTNGIFIDDKPSDLFGLLSKNPKEIIRLRRIGSKYSIEDLENSKIKEYTSLSEIPLN